MSQAQTQRLGQPIRIHPSLYITQQTVVTSCQLFLFNSRYEGSPYGYEAPSLYRIDAETFTVEKQFKFKLGDWPSEVQLNGDGTKLYWLNKDVWQMDVTANRIPVRPFLEYQNTLYYGLTVNPANGEVYIADAIDYQQQGMIYRYSPDGELIDEFYVGIIPGAFCWK